MPFDRHWRCQKTAFLPARWGLPASKSSGAGHGLPRHEPRRGEAPRQSGAPACIEPACPILLPARFHQRCDASRACRMERFPRAPGDEGLGPASGATSSNRGATVLKSESTASGFDFDSASRIMHTDNFPRPANSLERAGGDTLHFYRVPGLGVDSVVVGFTCQSDRPFHAD